MRTSSAFQEMETFDGNHYSTRNVQQGFFFFSETPDKIHSAQQQAEAWGTDARHRPTCIDSDGHVANRQVARPVAAKKRSLSQMLSITPMS